ncbi:MAG: bifunctional adenosylcobinamide kinase/adenosylcobinamide-phosphate guanylyltransferase, partial [Candidatus Nanopelagicales bacterium]
QLRETLDLASVLRSSPAGGLVLVDCLALWVTGLVDVDASWLDAARAEASVDRGLDTVLPALRVTKADVVLVTNEVGSGVVPPTASGRLFRDLLGRVNARVAAACDDVELVVAGVATSIKGRPWTPTT